MVLVTIVSTFKQYIQKNNVQWSHPSNKCYLFSIADAYVRPDIQSNKWYRFNDDIVDEVSFQEVIEDAFGGKSSEIQPQKTGGPFGLIRRLLGRGGESYGWGGKTSNAYVVNYIRRSDIPLLYGEQ